MILTKINDGDLLFPITEIAEKTVYSLFIILTNLIKSFSNKPDPKNDHLVEYYHFASKDELTRYIKSMLPEYFLNHA
jgi:hypothetical protein